MVNLAGAFVARGRPVDMVLVEASGPYMKGLAAEVRVVDLRARRMLRAVPALAGYLRRERPVALLSALTYANLGAIWARRLSRTAPRLVISEQNFLSVAARNAATSRKRTTPHLARLFYRWADAVAVISRGVGEDLAAVTGLPTERMSLIYNPVVTPDLDARAAAPVSHPWFDDGGPPVVLAVGRLAPQKDYPTMLRAFRAVRSARPARLMILGEGPDRDALAGMVGDFGLAGEVAMPGFVENPMSYMSRAAVFVLSSRWEGFGNVLAEALAAGCPVVSTDCPSGPSEILDDGRFGALVAVGDDAALAAAIVATLHAPPDRAVLKKRAAAFSVEPIAAQYLDLLLQRAHPG